MNLQPFVDAWHAHNWILFAALVIGGLIAFAKQGWFSAWIQTKLPPRAIPWEVLALAIISSAVTEIQSGVALQTALVHALMAALVAIMGHNVVIEGLRGGKELVPEPPWKKKPPSDDDKKNAETEPAPAMPPVAKALGLAFVLMMLSCTKQQALALDQFITDFSNAVCKQAESQPEPGWVYVTCTGVAIIENGVATILPLVTRKLPAAEAPKFLSAHAAKLDGGKE